MFSNSSNNDSTAPRTLRRCDELAHQNLNKRGTFKLLGEFLYWQVFEQGLEYGTLAKSDVGFFNIWFNSSTSNLGTFNESVLLPHFEYKPGFRAIFGYEFEQFDHWETRVIWTQINGKAHGSATCDGNTAQIFPEWLVQNASADVSSPTWTGNYVVEAKETWWQWIKIADLELARSILLKSYLDMEVFGGIRAAWMNQKLIASSTGFNPIFGPPSLFYPQPPVPIKGTQKYNSLGLHGGCYFNWIFSKNWRLFMKGALGFQYGKQQIHERMIGNFANSVIESTPLNLVLRKLQWLVGFNCEQAFGFSWDYQFKKQSISVSIGYELQQWFDYNGLMPVNLYPGNFNSLALSTFQQNIVKPGNLYMQGGTLSLQFDF